MSVAVFLGPTLPAASVAGAATVRGPIGCGDAIQAVRDGFTTLAIIDGVFDQRPSVWHKELLWALHRGCRVVGAASMGALRAAELSSLGMEGVGQIYTWYRDGLLEDDDEVAVAHGDATTGYRPMSEAMVNIRVTLHCALGEAVVTKDEALALILTAKRRFYPERTLAGLLDDAARQGALADAGQRLRQWLGPNLHRRVDQKAEDARALLDVIAGGTVPERREPAPLAYTEGFHELMRSVLC